MLLHLGAYDLALRRNACFFTLEYDGQLPRDDLEAAFRRILEEYPELAGQLQKCPGSGTYAISTPPNASEEWAGRIFSYHQQQARPKLSTLYELWRSGSMPPMQPQQLAAVRVTYYKDCDRSLMLFLWDHALMDADSFVTIITRWFGLTAAAAACNNTLAPALAVSTGAAAAPARERLAHVLWPSCEQQAGSCSCAAQQWWPPIACGCRQCSSHHSAAAALETAGAGTSTCGATAAAGSSQCGCSGAGCVEEGCRRWLAAHPPSFFDPLDGAGRCRAAWTLLGLGFNPGGRHIVGFIPRLLLDKWKSDAAASKPLPPGQFYSGIIAAAAMLAATVYLAAQDKHDRRGGLGVHFVVNCRGGRAGMAIPANTVGNASLWGLRVWVPQALLAAAKGTASPELMHHIKTEMAAQLQDPHGALNQQFATWAAVTGAGLSSKAHITGHLKLLPADGDITIDCLPNVATHLPPIPGTRLRYALCRWSLVTCPRLFLAGPTLPKDTCAAGAGVRTDSCSSAHTPSSSSGACTCGTCGVRFEVILRLPDAARVAPLWEGLGVRLLTRADAEGVWADVHGAGGCLWTVFEMLLFPRFLRKGLCDLFQPLPDLLLALAKQGWAWACSSWVGKKGA